MPESDVRSVSRHSSESPVLAALTSKNEHRPMYNNIVCNLKCAKQASRTALFVRLTEEPVIARLHCGHSLSLIPFY